MASIQVNLLYEETHYISLFPFNFFIDGCSITLGSPFNLTDNRFLFILVTIIFLSFLGHLSPSY